MVVLNSHANWLHTDETPTPLELARRDWLEKADTVADYREAHSLVIETYETMRAVARVALRRYQRLEAEEAVNART